MLRILVVDDEPLIRWSITEMLADSGHHVTSADDAAAGLRAIAEAPRGFDIVLLDYRLPDSSDLTLLATIRCVSPRSAVIMMTAHGTPDMIDGARALGASRVVSKPFDMHDLPALVRDVCDSRGI